MKVRWIGSTWFLIALALVTLGAGPVCLAGAVQTSPWTWEDVPRVVALGDSHGSYEGVVSILQSIELLDQELHWRGGETHLVILGDMLDRGPGDIQILDLARRLQGEAQAVNGRVHVLLGNHEAMNLVQDFRYVSKEGYEFFAATEDPETRNRMRKEYIQARLRERKNDPPMVAALERAFLEKYPPGFFGRAEAFGPNGKYAGWLMDQNVIIRLDETVFVHGGLVEDVAMLGYERINLELFASIRKYWKARETLVRVGAVTPFSSFREVWNVADSLVMGSANGKKRSAANTIIDFSASLVVMVDGPLWYRGTSNEDERLERGRVFASLKWLDSKVMVVGHSITDSGDISSRFGGRVIRADVGLHSRGSRQALVISDGKARRFDSETGEYHKIEAEPLWGEANMHPESRVLPDELARILVEWDVESIRPLRKGKARPLLVSFRKRGVRVRGVFKDVSERPQAVPGGKGMLREKYEHEIAAYLVDRALGLGLVPVTVPRTLPDEGEGSLQYFLDGALDQKLLESYGLPDDYDDIIARQRIDAAVFDALIGNLRDENNILYLPEEGRIVLIDHAAGFSTEEGIGRFFPEGRCRLSPEMKSALQSLEMKKLGAQLADWLKKREFNALVSRRDTLLTECQDGF